MKATTVKASTTQRKSRTAASSITPQSDPPATAPGRLDCIATAAYYRAEARGFEPGRELDDWLVAEAEFEARTLP